MASFRDLRALGHDSDNNLLAKIADSLAIALGQRGHDRFVGGSVATSGTWSIIHAITTSVFNITRDGSVENNVTLIAGDRLYGQISSVTVTSGDVELYRNN